MSGSSAKRARWRIKSVVKVALLGALVLVAVRAALRRARTTEGSTGGREPTPTAQPVAAEPSAEKPVGPEPTPSAEPVAAEPSEEGTGARAPEPQVDDELDDELTGLPQGSRRAVRSMVAFVVLLTCAAIVLAIVLASPSSPGGRSQPPARRTADARHATGPPRAETVTSVSPTSGTTGVVSDTTIAVTFSDPLAVGSPDPSLSPAVTGTWQVLGSSELLFSPEASFVPSTTYTVTIPGGPSGIRARSGPVLAQSVESTFTIAPGSVLRLQQLLATLGYLPLSFSGATPAPAGMAIAQPGSFTWRDRGFPAAYTSQWSPTQFSALTKGAVMAFETQNGLDAGGTVGPAVWTALLADAAAGKKDGEPVTYVLVTKNLPEHLTVWVNGVLTFANVPCNTGVPGAPTTDGTYEVFEHVAVSNMRGTDVTGSSYDVTVPWASYFDGGEALHGYPRASYGFPQSNGCVEMPISTAGRVWPSTPIGTVVTVVGPTA